MRAPRIAAYTVVAFASLCIGEIAASGHASESAQEQPWAPYDSDADPRADYAAAQAAAQASGRTVMMVFGANWCPDCRKLAKAMGQSDTKSLIAEDFVVMHVDIGDWDHNQDFEADWDQPSDGGIPTVVVASPDGESLYVSPPGKLAAARRSSLEELHTYFSALAEWIRRNPSPT